MLAISQALKDIVYGYLFLMFDFNVGTLDIIPDFIGYVLFYHALKTLKSEVNDVKLLNDLALLLGGFSCVDWIFKTIGFSMYFQLVDMIVLIVTLYFDFHLISGIITIGQRYCFHEEQLKTMIFLRNTKVILHTVVYLITTWLPSLNIFILVIAQMFVYAWIVYCIYEIAKHLEKTA